MNEIINRTIILLVAFYAGWKVRGYYEKNK